jgi:hypothetical protein
MRCVHRPDRRRWTLSGPCAIVLTTTGATVVELASATQSLWLTVATAAGVSVLGSVFDHFAARFGDRHGTERDDDDDR